MALNDSESSQGSEASPGDRDNLNALVDRLRHGDDAAWDPLYACLFPRLTVLLKGKTFYALSREDREDIAQEAVVVLLTYLHRRSSARHCINLAFRAAINKAIDKVRKQGSQPADSLDTKPDPGTGRTAPIERLAATDNSRPDAQLERAERIQIVADCLESLDEMHRQVVDLRFLQEMSHDEIAWILGVPPGTVGSRLNEAKPLLWECLKRRGLSGPLYVRPYKKNSPIEGGASAPEEEENNEQ